MMKALVKTPSLQHFVLSNPMSLLDMAYVKAKGKHHQERNRDDKEAEANQRLLLRSLMQGG